MEPNRRMNLGLCAAASVILSISISLFLSNLLSLRQLFPHMFRDITVWVVFIESFLAYLIGFLLIITHNENLETMTKRKIINLLLITGIAIFIMLIGVMGSSFEYLNISSFTLIVLALMYYTINPEKLPLKTSILLLIGSSFFVLALLVESQF